MFLKCVSYQKSLTKRNKSQRKNTYLGHSPNPHDQNTFTDFFIRKHSSITPNQILPTPQEIFQQQDHNKPNKITFDQLCKNNQIQQILPKNNSINTPKKKGFQIKFINQGKNLLNVKNSYINKYASNYQDEKLLILQRKNKQNGYYVPKTTRTSSRYYELQTFGEGQSQRSKQRRNVQRRSLELKSRQNPSKSSNNLQADNHILINSYKIKSLVLGRNPKQQLINKQKRLVKRLMQLKNRKSKIQQQQNYNEDIARIDDNHPNQPSNRQSYSKYHQNYEEKINQTSRIQVHQQIQIGKYNHHQNSKSLQKYQNKKLSSFSSSNQNNSKYDNKQIQIKIQPWLKSGEEILINQKHDDDIVFPNSLNHLDFVISDGKQGNVRMDQHVNYQNTSGDKNQKVLFMKNSQNINHFKDSQTVNVNTSQFRMSRNSFRKIYSGGRSKNAKGTIQSAN